jgi:N-acetylmuramoyl-L-alanine amidase-like protein
VALTRIWKPSPNYSGGRSRNQLVIVHTSEGATTEVSLANFLASPQAAVSYQVCFDDSTDPNTITECVQPQNKAWAAMNANDWGVHGCLCTPGGASGGWSRDVWMSKTTMLQKCASWIAEECARYGIPVTKVDGAGINAGAKGVCGHGDCSNAGAGGSHFDPGSNFPWDHVLALAGGAAPSPVPPPTPPGLNAPMVTMGATRAGYHIFGGDGGVFTFGDAPFYGSLGGTTLNAPIVDACSRLDGSGYYMTAADGGVFSFGPGCPFLGSLGSTRLNAPIVSIMFDPDNTGYWLVAEDGGVFSFGAPFFGSMGSEKLNAPVVAGAAVSGGYYLAASDGGVFTFGNAKFYGSMGGKRLNKPVVDISVQADETGYILVGGDGGVFTFGSAEMLGGMGDKPLNWPVVGVAADPDGRGYWMVAADGGIFSFEAQFYGSGVQSPG